ncbi:TerB family tellurite resistance protein [Mucilaginibacter agri]|uniref:TerB family tellurite resistance protein n=1 Tax=Mucilaginibacter agri TaxID=2695265 RepID=UPI0014123671|nr:TerB family tellurite resistance protein [Mucilaginibacter agri]
MKVKVWILGGITLMVGMIEPGRCFAQVQEMQQLLLNIEKLTQMKSILSDMKTGYQIYQQGYGSISSLAKGNFSLHETYLNGLLAVSPSVKNYARIADILSLQASLVSEYKRKQALFRQSGSFSVGELSYISDVYARLVSQTLNDAGELADILMAGKLRMSDADRIRAIDRIYTGSSDRLQFLRSFNNQGMAISLQRSKESGDTRTLNRLYGIQ